MSESQTARPHAEVERDDRGDLRIRWPQHPEANVYAGAAPDAIDRSEPVARLEAGSATIPAARVELRPFFELVAPDGETECIVAERLLPLEGAHNFRDLGGYETREGGRVAWGQLYRSDHLAGLTPADLDYIETLGIRLIVDFRGAEEIGEQPNRVPSANPPRQINPAILGTALQPGQIRNAIMTGNPEGLDFRTLLREGNRTMATRAFGQFRVLFEHLEHEDHVPLLFHCTAGKDRTGLAAALILIALGVPEELAMEDYLLTALYTHDTVEASLATMRIRQGFAIDLDEVRPMMSVRREYLQSAFDGIQQEFGGFDRYIEQALGISKPRLEALRTRLVV